ncbi:hypothetical protein D9757_014948 [Collybiopsis confluens]|uniref:GmrSD restriction endonucleases N-terminal domain-containing protein n=1 Tax=Collybiopsis confluens TaxID=2823264 RepID=A0A8H5FRN4_9AGAR|nr:hypothetical protein D9757_014948 [Collybiopsis confluens]
MALSASPSQDIDQLEGSRSHSSETCVGSSSAVFVMPKALKRPRDSQFSVQSLYEYIKRGFIDVNPEYQRDVVWRTEKQIMLIDSVFTNHYMPPIIFSVIYDDNGTENKKICLDGKQRLTSLQLFLDGLIPLKHPDTGKPWWFKINDDSGSKSRNLLPERIRTTFVNRQIRCTEYEDLDEEDEREIFRRVQLGMALSSAEKLRVVSSPRAKFINDIRDLYITEDKLGAPSFRWDRSRGADFRCLSQSVYVMYKWGDDKGAFIKNAGTLPQVEKWLEEHNTPVPGDFARSVKQTFAILADLVSPIEVIGVSVLIYVHLVIAPPANKLTMSELSAAVSSMRREVRKEHKDIRLNDRVGKTIIGFVKSYQRPAAAPAPALTPPHVPVAALPPIATLDNPRLAERMTVNPAPTLPLYQAAKRTQLSTEKHKLEASSNGEEPPRKRRSAVEESAMRAHRVEPTRFIPSAGSSMLPPLPFAIPPSQYVHHPYLVGPSSYYTTGPPPSQALYHLHSYHPPPSGAPQLAGLPGSSYHSNVPVYYTPGAPLITVKTEPSVESPTSTAAGPARRVFSVRELEQMNEPPAAPASRAGKPAPVVYPSSHAPSHVRARTPPQ